MVKLQAVLEYAIHEAIWMTLENSKEVGQEIEPIIEGLFEIAHGREPHPVNEADDTTVPDCLNLKHYVKMLVSDVMRVTDQAVKAKLESDAEEAHWRELYEGEKQAGLLPEDHYR